MVQCQMSYKQNHSKRSNSRMTSTSNQILSNNQQSFSSFLQNFKSCIRCRQSFKNYKRHFSGCQHDHKICYQCYIQHIEQKMQDYQVLTCPYCPSQMLLVSQNVSTFLKHLPVSKQQVIKQYVNKSQSKIQNWTCTIQGCGGKIPNQICQKCGQHYCSKCRQKQHPLEGCPVYLNTSTTSSAENDNKITCPQCDFINEISQKDRKKKSKPCENKYCNAYICVQHRRRWNKNHDNYHPANQRIFQKTPTWTQDCLIY